MSEQVAASAPSAVSFLGNEQVIVLTDGQRGLLKLLKDRLATGVPISRDDIFELYIKHNIPSRTYLKWDMYLLGYDHVDRTWRGGYRQVSVDDPSRRKHYIQRSRQWFASNLGICILKGRIIALPVIDAE